MRAIYVPSGRALEYSPLALNLYTGCAHGCSYCYAPSSLKRKRDEFHLNVQPRKGILEAIEKDCKRMKGDPRPILMCFHCDPYPPEGTCEDVTRPALEILEKYKMTAQVLTKAGLLATRDFDILKRNDWQFGTTLLLYKDTSQAKWEPNAATYESRHAAIIKAYQMDIRTWVSVEPVVDTCEALSIISDLRDIVDFWKIGKINHQPDIEKSIDWKKFLADVRSLLGDRPHLIKHDLLKAAGEKI